MGREGVTLASLVSSLDLSPERPHVETQRKAHPHLGTTVEASAFSLPGDLSSRHPSLPVHRQLPTANRSTDSCCSCPAPLEALGLSCLDRLGGASELRFP